MKMDGSVITIMDVIQGHRGKHVYKGLKEITTNVFR